MNAILKKILMMMRDLVEIYIPVIAFTLLFVTFILQIFYRYVLNQPLTWPYEVTVMCYGWVALLGACYARRTKSNVAFSMAYDKWSPKGQAIARIIGNLITTITFGILFYPAFDYVSFMKIKKTTVLRVPLNLAFSCFLIFVIIIMLYSLIDIAKDVKLIKEIRSKSKIKTAEFSKGGK